MAMLSRCLWVGHTRASEDDKLSGSKDLTSLVQGSCWQWPPSVSLAIYRPISGTGMQVTFYTFLSLAYSPSGHPSGPENWPVFQWSHACTWQCHTLKCSATHLVFNIVRNVSRLFFCCAQQAKICYSHGTADDKWWPLTLWTLGQWISQLIARESDQHGAYFETFLK